jgi:hypothetical protein
MYLARQARYQKPQVFEVDVMFAHPRVWPWKASTAAAVACGPDGVSALGHTPKQALNLLDGHATPAKLEVTPEDIES